MVFAFGEFELDIGACALRRRGRSLPLRLQPKVFDVLRYLIEHRDRVVSKEELIDALWDGQSVNRIAVPWSVSHARKALGQSGTESRPIETVRGKGYRFAADVHRVPQVPSNAPADAPPPSARARPNREPFLGRDDVMERLVAALDDARAGHGRLVLLTGEAGIGKTRCASELASIARRSGFVVSLGRCAGGGAPAFWPWIQMLREYATEHLGGSAERKAIEAMLRRLTPRAVDAAPASPAPALSDTSRFWLSEALARCLRQTAEKHLRVLVVDDLHAADEGSLEALAQLALDLAGTKMTVVATAREGPMSNPSAAGLSTRLRPSDVVALCGLSYDDVERYLSDAIGQTAPRELARTVYKKTSGNPLFLKEAARLVATRLHRRGTLRTAEIGLPEVAKGFLYDRIATLDPATRETLDAASVIGDDFELGVLQRITGKPIDPLIARLDVAARARFVEPRVPERSFAFAHALIREALYEALPAPRRTKLHEDVAAALQSLLEPRVSEVAYHLHLARPTAANAEAAARYGRLAGDAAMQVFAYDEAAEFYGWAFASLGDTAAPDPRAGCELLLAAAMAYRRAGRVRDARTHCRRAIEIADREGFPDLLVAGARSLRPTVWTAQVPDALVLGALERARGLLPEDALASRARGCGLLAGIPPYSARMDVSLSLGEEALGLARGAGDRSLLLEVLVSTFPSLSGPDSIPLLLARVDDVLRLDGNPASWWSAEAFFARHHALLQRGEASAAARALEDFGECARQLRMPEALWQYDRVRAQRAVHVGDFDGAEARFQELLARSAAFRPYGTFETMAHLSVLQWERTGRPLPATCFGTSPDLRWKWTGDIPAFRAEKILSWVESGDSALARAEFEDLARDEFRAVTRDVSYLYALARLALAAVALQRPGDARVLYGLLRPYRGLNALNGLSICIGSVSHFLGVLARFLEMRAEAVAHLEEALAMNTALGHKVHALRTQLALAELLCEPTCGPSAARGRSLAGDVVGAARALGMGALAADAARLASA
jgi:eukaryotic-like serine/threonine-protein kinase